MMFTIKENLRRLDVSVYDRALVKIADARSDFAYNPLLGRYEERYDDQGYRRR